MFLFLFNMKDSLLICGCHCTNKATDICFGSKESGTELSEHFTSSAHDTKDMRVHILDNNPKWKKIERLLLEDYYMCKL